jgi:hypothetical protein
VAVVKRIPKTKRKIFVVEKREIKATFNIPLLNLGFSLRKSGRINKKAKKNLMKTKLKGGISSRPILERTGVPAAVSVAKIIANNAR